MKNLVILLLLIVLSSTICFSQVRKERYLNKSEGKIERLEQIKLIEALELNEESTLAFFARRSEHRKKMRQLQGESEEILNKLSNIIDAEGTNENDIINLYNDYLAVEKRIFDERHSFINSLDDILTHNQIGKLIIFEKRFKQELKEMIIHERKRRRD